MRKLETGLHLTAIFLLCTSITATATEYYTWVDENGVVNYSERNPVGYDARYVTEETRFGYRNEPRRSPAPAPTPTTTAPDSAQEDEGDSDINPDELIAEQKAQYEAELAAERKKNCDLAKQNLARLETYARIRVKGDDGKMRYLTEAEMNTKRKESREAIKFHCR